jgi:hypothetical protein
MARTILLSVYVIACLIELAGIKLTVSLFVRDNNDGTITFDAPEGWRAARGPVLIAIGVTCGLAGNIVSLFVT